jgi:hypothetical protein
VVSAFGLTLLVAAVEVAGSSACPEPALVAAGLAGILPPEVGAAPDRATLSPTLDERSVLVELRRADGVVLASRRVAAGGSCAETAEIVAVVIASWEARFRSGLAGPLDIDVRSPPPPPPARHRRVEGGAAALVSRQGSDVAPAARVELAVGIASGHFALRAAPLLVWGHRTDVPPGTAAWSRAGLGVGARFRLTRGRLWGDAVIDLLATALFSRGSGFATERTGWSFDPGAATWLRGGVSLGRVEPWLGAATIVWPRTQRMQVQGLPNQAVDLPHLELFMAAGLSFRFAE